MLFSFVNTALLKVDLGSPSHSRVSDFYFYFLLKSTFLLHKVVPDPQPETHDQERK